MTTLTINNKAYEVRTEVETFRTAWNGEHVSTKYYIRRSDSKVWKMFQNKETFQVHLKILETI